MRLYIMPYLFRYCHCFFDAIRAIAELLMMLYFDICFDFCLLDALLRFRGFALDALPRERYFIFSLMLMRDFSCSIFYSSSLYVDSRFHVFAID